MSIIIILLGAILCSSQSTAQCALGSVVIIAGILYALLKQPKKKHHFDPPPSKIKTGESDSAEGYTGRVQGDTYFGVYDRDGNYISESDLRSTIDGDFITPDGDIVTKDSDGEYRMY